MTPLFRWAMFGLLIVSAVIFGALHAEGVL